MQLIRLTDEQEARLKKITKYINMLRIENDKEALKPYEVAKELIEKAIKSEEKNQNTLNKSDIALEIES